MHINQCRRNVRCAVWQESTSCCHICCIDTILVVRQPSYSDKSGKCFRPPCCEGKADGLPRMQARSSAHKVQIMRKTTAHIEQYIKWHTNMQFLPAPELKAWQRYCSFMGLYQGYVVLQLRPGALLKEVCAISWHGSAA